MHQLSSASGVVRTAVFIALAAIPSAAQWGGPVVGSMHTSKVTVADDLGVDPLEVARRAAEAGDFERAVAAYQEILDRLPDLVWHSHRAVRSGAETERVLDGDRFVGLRNRVHELLRALPGEGFAQYVKSESPKADEEFARASAARDEDALRRVVRRRRILPAGLRAYAALADLAFEDGRLADAAVRAEAAATDSGPGEEAFRRRMLLRAGLGYAGLGDRENLTALRARLTAADDAEPVLIGGEKIVVSAALDAFLAKIPSRPAETTEAPVFAARPWAPIPLEIQESESRWDERWLSFGRYVNDSAFSYAPIMPLVAEGVIYLNNGLELNAVSLYTGKRLFNVPGRADRFQGRRNWNVTYDCVLDGDLVFAYLEDEPQIRADPRYQFQGYVPIETIPTRKLYAVEARTGDVRWTHARQDGAKNAEERAFLTKLTVNTAPLVVGDRLYVGGVFYHGGFRHWLCCFDRDTGAIVWRTFVALGQAEQNMFGNPVKDCSPGLVGHHRGLLVYSTNVGVVAAVDAATGAPSWMSAYLQEPIPSVDGPGAVERAPGFAPHRPVFAGGTAFLGPADSISFLAFDLATGESKVLRDKTRDEAAVRTASNPLRHVVDYRDGLLVLAGTELVAFDLTKPEDPAFKWRTGSPGAGARSGPLRAGIEGKPGVADGKAWFAYKTAGADPRINKTRLMAVELSSGRRVDEQFADGAEASGNIVFADDAAVVASGRHIAAYFDLSRASQRAADAVARDPADARRRLRLGQLKLQAGATGDALNSFKEALQAAEAQGGRGEASAAAARLALYNTYLSLGIDFLRTGPGIPPSAEERFDLASTYAASSRQRAAALMQRLVWSHRASNTAATASTARTILAEHADESANFDRAFGDALRGLEPGRPAKAGVIAAVIAAAGAERVKDFPLAATFYGEALRRFPEEPLTRTTGETVSTWRHCYDALDALIKNHGPAVYAKEEALARAQFEAAGKSGDVRGLRRVVDEFPNASSAADARILLVRTLRTTERPLDALAAAQRELARFGADEPAMVLEASLALEAAGFHASARDMLVSLKSRFGPRTLQLADGDAATADVYVARRLAEPRFVSLDASTPPAAPLGAAVAWSEKTEGSSDAAGPELVIPRGKRPLTADGFVLIAAEGELRALDLSNSARIWRRPVRQSPVFPVWRDDRLYFAAGDAVICLDPRDGAEAWTVRLTEGAPLALEAAHGKIYVLVREAGGGRAVLLRSLDAATGERLRDLRFPLTSVGGEGLPTTTGGASLEADAEHLLVRLVGADRGAVIDGLTGAPSLGGFALKAASGVLPMLAPGGLLAMSPASGNLRSGERRIVGRRIGTQDDVWTWKAERVRGVTVARKIGPSALLIALERDVAGGKIEKEVVLLDLEKGGVLLSKKLQTGEFVDAVMPGVLDGELLLLSMRRAGSPGSVFVRAYDIVKDELRWESVPGAGRSPTLRIYPAKDHVAIRVTAQPSNATGRVAFKRQGALRILDRRTGKVVDEITIDNDEGLSERPDVEIREGVLLVETAAGIESRK